MSNTFFNHHTAEVNSNAKIGKGTKIWNYVQIRENAVIGENCIISKDVYIDEGVEIGNQCKIQNGISVYKGVKIEDKVFLGPHMVFTNDLFPRAFNDEWQITNTTISEGASIGANATIVCGNKIGRFAMVAAGTVVTKDVPDYGLVVGNPSRLLGYVCECGKRIRQENNTHRCTSCYKEYILNNGIMEEKK